MAQQLRLVIADDESLIRMNLKVSENDDAVGVRATFSVGGQAAGETVLKLGKANDF